VAHRSLKCGTIVISALLSVQAFAQLVNPVSQNRYVQNTSTTVTAPDFGHFQASIVCASQTSDILANSLQAVGAICTGDTQRITRSHYGVIFDLSVPTDYTLACDFTANGSTAFAESSVQFRPVGGTDIHFHLVTPVSGERHVSFSGSLQPGQYELILYARGSNADPIGGGSNGSFSGTLTLVRCTADLNIDGIVDLTDLSLLLSCFGAGSCGDVDADGDSDLSDLAQLLAQFGQACE